MPYLVTTAFDEFYKAINLSGDHRGSANKRRDWVAARLGSKMTLVGSPMAIGSIPRFTAVTGHADADVLVVLHYGKHIEDRKPSNVLLSVKNALSPVATVRRNGQAVTVKFESWPAVDVVPAAVIYSDKATGTVAHYEIPDMHRETWIKTKPNLHTRNINDAASVYGDDFRRVIKMIKWWNHRHGAPMQSFHIEVLALEAATSSDLSWALFQWFKEADATIGSSLWHEGGQVDGYLDWSQRQKVSQLLSDACNKARGAWAATYGASPDHKTAIKLWGSIFGQRFPTYG